MVLETMIKQKVVLLRSFRHRQMVKTIEITVLLESRKCKSRELRGFRYIRAMEQWRF